MTLKKNDSIELAITGMTAQGSGVGRYAGIAVFVANAAVGDRLKIKIIKTSKNYAIGKLKRSSHPRRQGFPQTAKPLKAAVAVFTGTSATKASFLSRNSGSKTRLCGSAALHRSR